MVAFSAYLLSLAAICNMVVALPPAVQMFPNMKVGNLAHTFSFTDKYPLPNDANVPAHDPNLLETNGAFYLIKGGVHIPILKATDLNGPWKQVGTVLSQDSVIKGHGNATRPWAPTVVEWKGQFYCFYSLSAAGSRHSAIGVASTKDIEKGPWKDHGALFTTGDKHQGTPFDETNAIDPSFVVDQQSGVPYLNYGSYWKNIWQVPLEDDLLSLKNNTIVQNGVPMQAPKDQKDKTPQVKAEPEDPKNDKRDNNNKKHPSKHDNKDSPKLENHSAVQLTFEPGQKIRPEEGSWISHHDGFYYLWYSHGKCCNFEKGFPKKGEEYSIRVGRSENVQGPYHDKDGKELLKGGGTIIYGSNHGTVYAPGGLGVLPGTKQRPDILYFHYLDTNVGFKHGEAKLGWNFLEYENGWPVARKNNKSDFKQAKQDDKKSS